MKQKEYRPKKRREDYLLENNQNYGKDGVDLSLIQWMLSMTPTERLQVLQQNIRSIMRLRGDKTHT